MKMIRAKRRFVPILLGLFLLFYEASLLMLYIPLYIVAFHNTSAEESRALAETEEETIRVRTNRIYGPI
jgi:hypothetical protein